MFHVLFCRNCESKVFSSDYPICDNMMIKLKGNIPSDLLLTSYVTTEECSIPNVELIDNRIAYRTTKHQTESDNKLINLGSEEFKYCGLHNLVVVLYNSDNQHVEHQSQSFFVNCTNVDLGLPNLYFQDFIPITLGNNLDVGSIMEYMTTEEGSGNEGSGDEGSGDGNNDDIFIDVTNHLDGQCDAKVLVCMWCPWEDDNDLSLDTVEVLTMAQIRS